MSPKIHRKPLSQTCADCGWLIKTNAVHQQNEDGKAVCYVMCRGRRKHGDGRDNGFLFSDDERRERRERIRRQRREVPARGTA